MRRITSCTFCVIGLLSVFLPALAHASGEVVAEPPVITPGQSVKLRWYFTGTRVVVAGGRFGTGMTVTGKTSLTDTPRKTTRYTFDVYYNGTETNSKGERITGPLHQQYVVVAQVDTSPPIHMTSYRDPHGWKIDYFTEWHCDISTPDTGNKGLMFFQKEDDSVERMAVAVMPANEMTNDDLVKKIISQVPSGYSEPTIEPDCASSVGDTPAKTVIFSGMDMTHPGTKTKSEVLMVVHNGRAYFISVRCSAAQFNARQRNLERMLKSFGFTSAAATSAQPPYIKQLRVQTIDQI